MDTVAMAASACGKVRSRCDMTQLMSERTSGGRAFGLSQKIGVADGGPRVRTQRAAAKWQPERLTQRGEILEQ